MKQQIKFGINFPEIGAITLMTAKLRYAVNKLTPTCINNIYNFRETMNLMYSINVRIRQDHKYIILEFACITNTMVLHELQHLQYDIARTKLDRRFHLMHQVDADMEAAAYEQHQYNAMQQATHDTIITQNGTHYWLHKPEGIEF